jgi:poly(hydroxyalkanoate) depolymerase family esterase
MPKSFGSIWLRGVKRLMKIQRDQASQLTQRRKKEASAAKRAALKAATQAAAAATKAAKAAATTAAAKTAKTAKARTTAKGTETRPSMSTAIWPRPRSGEGPSRSARVRAQGTWTRSFFSAPPVGTELINHMAYGLYLPRRPKVDAAHAADTADARPLVVMLHGCRQNIEDFAQGTGMNLLADRNDCAVLYPEQSKHAQAHRCWRWYDETPGAGAKEAASIAALVRAIVAEHRLDASRVYVAGLSAGAGMTMLLAIRYPTLFAAIGLHSGVTFGEARTAATAVGVMHRGARRDPVELIRSALDGAVYPGMPALIVHGDSDDIVAQVNGDQLEMQCLQLNGALAQDGKLAGAVKMKVSAAHSKVIERDYRAGNRVIVRACRVAGLKHGWSGGDPALPFNSAQGPNASALMWEFFRLHRRN